MQHSTLLLTNDAKVVALIQQIHDESESARLEVCGRVEKALPLLNGPNRLVVVDSRMDSPYLESILVAAKQLGIRSIIVDPCVVSSDMSARYSPLPLDDTWEHAVYPLPAGLPALRRLIESFQTDVAESTGDLDLGPVAAALLGSSMKECTTLVHRMAGQNATVLLTGETGCGKSMLARVIHETSPRRAEPYMVVDCGALSDHLIESELFGHVRGAFTGADRDRPGKLAAAGSGTLVLDEVNSLPLPLQAKLLRAVEDRLFEPVGSNRSEPLRARLIAVSNVPLEDEVQAGRFRSDLYYRLNVLEMRLPPLRERRDAIVPLAAQFLHKVSPYPESASIAPSALSALLAYPWPGNVRELRNALERATALASGPVIHLEDLPARIHELAHPGNGPVARFEEPRSLTVEGGDTRDERAVIIALLRKHRNNRCRVARDLGVSRMTLYKKLHKYGIFVPKSGVEASQPA